MEVYDADEMIKKGLQYITDDFQQLDIDFVKALDYPVMAKVIEIDPATKAEIVKDSSREVGDLEELIKFFKTVDGPGTVKIESNVTDSVAKWKIREDK